MTSKLIYGLLVLAIVFACLYVLSPGFRLLVRNVATVCALAFVLVVLAAGNAAFHDLTGR